MLTVATIATAVAIPFAFLAIWAIHNIVRNIVRKFDNVITFDSVIIYKRHGIEVLPGRSSTGWKFSVRHGILCAM